MMLSSLSAVGYAVAAVAFLILGILLVTSWQGKLHGAMLAIAAIVSALWGFALAIGVTDPALAVVKVFLAETLRNGSWLVFLSVLFAGGAGGGAGHRVLVYGGPVLAGGVLISGVSLFVAERTGLQSPGAGEALISGSLALSLFTLIMVEQIYRNARDSRRGGLKYIGLGLIGMFGYDLVLYTHAILFGRIDELLWSVRGFVAALCVPLIAVSAQRNPSWAVGIFVSRHVVFFTTTLIAAGVYLMLMAGIGYYIRIFGGAWGPAAQLIFFAAAILTLALLFFSGHLRARLRVFLSKHFFRNRYDYREEWLRLIGTLSSKDDGGLSLRKRAIKALSDIVGVQQGLLFVRDQEEGPFRCDAGWNAGTGDLRVAADSSLACFLERTGWVVDAAEYRLWPERYKDLDTDLGELGLEQSGYIVPLFTDEQLASFVVLGRPKTARRLNFEDHDLLKTAGRQIASYLDQEQKKWELAESRQFETFNRLTTYLMHDLKNLIAQQSLVVENYQKHKDKPEFVEDAIATVKGGVARMRKVLEQLAQGAPVSATGRIELSKLLLEAASECADRRPEPRVEVGDSRLWVRADRERLLMALVHAIRNAQDATPPEGGVTVHAELCGTDCVITVSDTGRGMDQAFIENRLFRPFDSTKGTNGMGIGAHQIRETVRALGGQVHVDSSPGAGTRVSLRLPLEPVVEAV
ncbi:MAG TPA: XrtA/PEP-CTERM system histidine kinase PrsK [Woeseiaceae bacterium]|nr:XrtA/PEP-CTERM system histidine kinase PrsK [Woeseiaceae bacterium]